MRRQIFIPKKAYSRCEHIARTKFDKLEYRFALNLNKKTSFYMIILDGMKDNKPLFKTAKTVFL